MSDTERPNPTPLDDTTASHGLSRRRLVRAGLSAAPVMAALKSNTVLAGGSGHSCVRPSSFSSLTAAQMQVSRGRVIKDDYSCASHGFWKNRSDGLPKDYKTKTLFIGGGTGFSNNPNGAFSNLSLQQVLGLKGNQNNTALARHVTAAFLSAVAVKNDPDRVMLSKSQCAQIWNGQGFWSPFAGAHWTYDDTMNYFEAVYGWLSI